jgi:hypothetical protein
MLEQKPMDTNHFEETIKEWEWTWVNLTSENYSSEPRGNPKEIAENLFKKYGQLIQ